MPWGDCTGPWWLHGRGYGAPGFWDPWCRARWCWRPARVFYPFREPAPDEEVRYLEDLAADLEEELKAIRERLERLRSTR